MMDSAWPASALQRVCVSFYQEPHLLGLREAAGRETDEAPQIGLSVPFPGPHSRYMLTLLTSCHSIVMLGFVDCRHLASLDPPVSADSPVLASIYRLLSLTRQGFSLSSCLPGGPWFLLASPSARLSMSIGSIGLPV